MEAPSQFETRERVCGGEVGSPQGGAHRSCVCPGAGAARSMLTTLARVAFKLAMLLAAFMAAKTAWCACMHACMWWRCQLTASLCLPPCRVQFVNVWTRAAAKKLPVMVFIYGGSLITGDSKWYVPREVLTVASLFALPYGQPTLQVSTGRACSERRGCGCQHQLPPERLWFYGIAGPWDCRPSRCQRKLRLPRPAARLAMGARQHRCVWR